MCAQWGGAGVAPTLELGAQGSVRAESRSFGSLSRYSSSISVTQSCPVGCRVCYFQMLDM